MNHQTKDFQSKIRKYHSIPEAVVIDCKAVGYPFYVLHLDLTYLANRDLELLEEFTIKCILNGLNKIREISGFLGVADYLIEKVLSELLSKELVKREDVLRVTEKGLDALQQQTVVAPTSETKIFYLDALSGRLTQYLKFNFFDVKKYPKNSISTVIKKPKKANVGDLVKYYQDIESFLQDPNSQNYTELIQVNKIEKVYPQWHEVLLVLYKNKPSDCEIEYEIFSRGSIQKDYRETIEQLYAEGNKVLDSIFKDAKKIDNLSNDLLPQFECIKGISNEDITNVEQLSAKISSLNEPDIFIESQTELIKEEKRRLTQELQQVKDKTRISEVVHTYELRNYLFKALKEAKDRVMIVSPWIKRNVVDNEFLEALEFTLKRKVKVYIIYGIKGSTHDRWSVDKLETLMDNNKNFTFAETKNSHRKQIVCDDKFAIVTSFNFLSFRADPNLTYRDELGVILKDKQTIEDLFSSGLALIS